MPVGIGRISDQMTVDSWLLDQDWTAWTCNLNHKTGGCHTVIGTLPGAGGESPSALLLDEAACCLASGDNRAVVSLQGDGRDVD